MCRFKKGCKLGCKYYGTTGPPRWLYVCRAICASLYRILRSCVNINIYVLGNRTQLTHAF